MESDTDARHVAIPLASLMEFQKLRKVCPSMDKLRLVCNDFYLGNTVQLKCNVSPIYSRNNYNSGSMDLKILEIFLLQLIVSKHSALCCIQDNFPIVQHFQIVDYCLKFMVLNKLAVSSVV